MLALYHNDMSACAQKVRLCLAEKGLQWDNRHLDLRAGDRAFAVLRNAAEKLCASMPPQGRPPVLMVALHIWAMSHGIASLFGRGDAARRTLPMSAEELLEANVLVYLRGLGISTGPSGRSA